MSGDAKGKARQQPQCLSDNSHIQKAQFASLALSFPPKKALGRSILACGATKANPIFEVGAAPTQPRLSVLELAARRPIALLGIIPKPLVLFGAGALSGALAKTFTAPLDRVKILLQVKGGLQKGAIAMAARQGNLLRSLIAVGQQEGIMGYWKGNLPQVLRVVPYSAAQLYSYEVFKTFLTDENGNLSVHRRFAAGACAGMTATIVSN